MSLAIVDVGSRNVKLSRIPEKDERELIGGKGIATKLLLSIPEKADLLSPENAIIFAVGPVNSFRLSGASRMTAVFKSPLTGGYGESQCGGFAPHEMALTGINALMITGRSDRPVYLVVEDGSVEVKPADHLWGLDAFETEEALRKDEGGEVIAIGQAGENLVRFACITHRRGRQFGRAGGGAVLGSKRVKAIVFKGDGESRIDREFEEFLDEQVIPKLSALQEYGTPNIMWLVNKSKSLPSYYWEKSEFDIESIDAEAMLKYFVRRNACYSCKVACGRISRTERAEVEGPEYETLYAFGSLLGNSNLKSIIEANELADRLGMDTISLGNAIGFAITLSRLGKIDERLDFGEGEKYVELVRKVAFREGVGNLLAEGVARMEKLTGVEGVHVNGLEPPAYDPRGIFGVALAYSTSPRGACHMRSCAYRPNLAGQLNRLSPEGQAQLVKELEDFYAVVDSLVYCRFLALPQIGMGWEDVARLLEISTGRKYGVEQLKRIGHMIHSMAWEFNRREGIEYGRLPSKLFEYGLRREDFERMLGEYVGLRG
ncbi:Aldehyde:ferredoxin oxidoreductase [Geoglobus ahangari]|uniref:Aldehyde:ferredoxin oxidoreductase n=1 Tax=Geoglobus ahangari TaxID=113653 RepID=A0A0F7IDJ4_9EURY|nr:aldehyde ferredoxin oxidoreductase family protein [Geoglobus ahangari]AKG90990.1 Aldehyde:ferredoxin oxidoreductase [Geoglobus ahangari]